MVKIIAKPRKKRRKDGIIINLTVFTIILKENNVMTIMSGV
jgi:hypothetical protein